MGEVAKGRFEHRIREQRKDEFGLLYAAFDQMAQALQDRQAGANIPTPTPPPPLRVEVPTAPLHRPVSGAATTLTGAPGAVDDSKAPVR